MYLAWAAFYEGNTDAAYFDIIIPRLLEGILLEKGKKIFTVPALPAVRLGSRGRTISEVASEICGSRSAFHLLFIHADAGGRALEGKVASRREAYAERALELCDWKLARTVYVSPRHEMEAWALADSGAVCRALGFTGNPQELNLPTTAQEAERLLDPKACLDEAARIVSVRRYKSGAASLLTSIAQEQSLVSLRTSRSFQEFERQLRSSLVDLGCLDRAP